MSQVIRIATRKSPLALWQSHHVADLITKSSKVASKKISKELRVELIPLSTKGDEILDKSLAKIGGKGLFISELEVALSKSVADIAVHSLKDVPSQLASGMTIGAILQRAEPSDVLVSRNSQTLTQLPHGATVGTSSQRRQSQLLNKRPDLTIKPLRGNVDTRLGKLKAGVFDAIVLAQAGLIRLGHTQRIGEVIDHQVCLPAAGQGAIAVECRADNHEILELLESLNHEHTAMCVEAERTVVTHLEGTCTSPIAAYASIKNGIMTLRARVASISGKRILETIQTEQAGFQTNIGARAAESLLSLGAKSILDATDEQ